MIDHIAGLFKITQYDDKRGVSMANLIETTWLPRYPRTTEIMYGQGS